MLRKMNCGTLVRHLNSKKVIKNSKIFKDEMVVKESISYWTKKKLFPVIKISST